MEIMPGKAWKLENDLNEEMEIVKKMRRQTPIKIFFTKKNLTKIMRCMFDKCCNCV